MLRNPGRIWQIKEAGNIAFSYNKEQLPEFIKLNKVLVYVTSIMQLSLFAHTPPKEHCQRILKSIEKLKLVGYMD